MSEETKRENFIEEYEHVESITMDLEIANRNQDKKTRITLNFDFCKSSINSTNNLSFTLHTINCNVKGTLNRSQELAIQDISKSLQVDRQLYNLYYDNQNLPFTNSEAVALKRWEFIKRSIAELQERFNLFKLR